MSLKVYLKIACFVTIIALLYIHMQMNIFELAYKGKDKEKIIHELNDSNGDLDHQILTLESANNLGNQLLDHDTNWQFMNSVRVMKVITTRRVMQELQAPKPKVVAPSWNLFSFLDTQQTKAWE